MVSGLVDSGNHKLSENILFVWSKTSYSGDKWRCHRCGTGRTNKQQVKIGLLIWETLSLAIKILMLRRGALSSESNALFLFALYIYFGSYVNGEDVTWM